MTTLEALMKIAEGQGECFDLMRQMMGTAEIALLIVNEVAKGTSVPLRPCNVAKAIGKDADTARVRIDNTVITPGKTESKRN